MKKSEKIELRINHAEKERLASIAERRGQTISDVVRDALAGELGVAPAAYPKWPGYVALFALGIAALSFLGLTESLFENANAGPVMSSTNLSIPGARGGPVLETQVPHRNGFSHTYSIKTETRHLQFTHRVSEISRDVYELEATLCEESEEKCLPVGETSLILSTPSDPPIRGTAVVRDGTGSEGEKDIKFVIESLGPKLRSNGKEAP